MAPFTRFPWPRLSVGLEVLPPTLMIALGHPWLGAATLGGVLASSVLQSWILVRSAQEQHRAILSYAQDVTSMGGDPATVIAALQGKAGDAEDVGAQPKEDDDAQRSASPWLPRPPRV